MADPESAIHTLLILCTLQTQQILDLLLKGNAFAKRKSIDTC